MFLFNQPFPLVTEKLPGRPTLQIFSQLPTSNGAYHVDFKSPVGLKLRTTITAA
jgi:hypothetical protein